MNSQTIKKYLVVDGDEYLDGNGYFQQTLSLAHRYVSQVCANKDLQRNKAKRPNTRVVPMTVVETIHDEQKGHI